MFGFSPDKIDSLILSSERKGIISFQPDFYTFLSTESHVKLSAQFTSQGSSIWVKSVLRSPLDILTSTCLTCSLALLYYFFIFFPADMYVSIRALFSSCALKSLGQELPAMETQVTTHLPSKIPLLKQISPSVLKYHRQIACILKSSFQQN